MYNIEHSTGLTCNDKAELVSYKLKDIAQVRYKQWKGNKLVGLSPIVWEEFKEAFMGKYFLYKRREVKD